MTCEKPPVKKIITSRFALGGSCEGRGANSPPLSNFALTASDCRSPNRPAAAPKPPDFRKPHRVANLESSKCGVRYVFLMGHDDDGPRRLPTRGLLGQESSNNGI